MNKFDYKNLTPFKWFVLENFPFIEADFDALTEWQLFCKLGKEINKIIDSQNIVGEQAENLTNAFNNLKNYVDNYFDNLDVQDEINNKLNEMATDGTLDEIIDKYITNKILHIYKTVSDMKNDTLLQANMICQTQGFYEMGDNGASYYIILENQTANESNIIELNNGLFAKFIQNTNVINVKQFGCKEDGQTDDSDKLQNLINYADTNNLEITGNSKKLLISKTIFFSAYSVVKNLYLRATKNGTYTNNYVISVNSSNVGDWDIQYPYAYKGKFENLEIENGTSNSDYNETLNCIYNVGNCQYKDILTKRFNISFRSSPRYLDVVKLKNINVTHKIGTDFAISFGYLGDASEIDTAHTFDNDLISNVNFIDVGQGHKGCILKNIINNGIMQILGSIVILENIHCEGNSNQIIIENSNVNFIGGFFYHNSPNIKINNSCVNLSNLEFIYHLNDYSYQDSTDIDVEINGISNVNINNCYKSVIENDINDKYLTGIKTNVSDTSYLSPNRIYNSNSRTGFLQNGEKSLNVGETYAAYPNISSNAKWFKDTNTYYYQFIPLLDLQRLLTCNNYKEKFSQNLTYGGLGFCVYDISVSPWRIYRGTKDNLYNSYADLGVIRGALFDNGFMINGNKWITRNESNIDSLNNIYVGCTYIGNNIITYMEQLPTIGKWNTGDIIYKYNPSTGEDIGWICKLGGTPGTWISLGKVQ